MSTTSDYEVFLDRSATALDKVCYTTYSNVGVENLSGYSSNCGVLDGLANTAFRVGNSNAFSAIIDKFFETVEEVKKQASVFLDAAEDCAKAINEHMGKDYGALTAASDAYTEVQQMPDTSPEFQRQTYCYNAAGEKIEHKVYDSSLRSALAEEKKQKAWRDNNCDDLWGD